MVKSLPANAEAAGDMGLIPGSGRSSGRGNSFTLQYSCLDNPMNRGACQGTVMGYRAGHDWVTEHTHTHTHIVTQPNFQVYTFVLRGNYMNKK